MNFEAILDILFPPECLACRKKLSRGTLCEPCKSIAGAAPAIALKNMDAQGKYYFLAAAGRYQNRVLKKLIHALKFGGVRGAATPLAEMLAHHAQTIALPLNTFLVMPIPLSKMRIRERGFNQSSLVAERFARLLDLPFEKNILVRVRHRKPQSSTSSVAERRENIRDCFAVQQNAALTYKNIILIDDVTTSGSTFLEAARTLTDAGAETILALAIARA